MVDENEINFGISNEDENANDNRNDIKDNDNANNASNSSAIKNSINNAVLINQETKMFPFNFPNIMFIHISASNAFL